MNQANKNLLSAKEGQTVIIKSFLDLDTERRLITRGVHSGASIKVMQKHKNGSIIIAKDNIRLALCKKTASQIIIISNQLEKSNLK